MKKTDKVIVVGIVLTVFFIRYIQVFYEAWYIFDVFLLTYIIYSSFNSLRFSRLKFLLISILSVALLIIIGLNVIRFGLGEIFLDNILMVFTPLTLILYFSYLLKKYSLQVNLELGRRLLYFLNVYFWINAIIIVIQYITGSFLMGRFLSWGMYDFDHMTGFIGPFGTGILLVFWSVLPIANIVFYLITRNKKWLSNFYLQLPIMIMLSFFNEAKSFLPTVLIFLSFFIPYMIMKIQFNVKVVIKVVSLFMIIGLIGTVLYQQLEVFKDLIDKMFELGEQFLMGAQLDTNNERAYLNYLAWNYYGGGSLGIGINTVDFDTQLIHKNLGINSLSLLLIHGGIWYFIIVVMIYSWCATNGVQTKFNMKAFVLYLIFLVIFFYLSLITQPFRDHYIMFMLGALVYYLSIYQKYKYSIEGN
ncbi:hypothetical protein [Priestia flexa]|uniref:hypothetical protein n=1 Tax=Priestia flexa TaxID=86664 RepID=UPI002491AD03|nr:hypothetical protein [Priestia flexa]